MTLLLQIDFVSGDAQRDVVAQHLPQLFHPDFHLNDVPQTNQINSDNWQEYSQIKTKYILCLKKTSPFLFLWLLGQMLNNFNNIW